MTKSPYLSALLFLSLTSRAYSACELSHALPVNVDDFDEPDWKAIVDIAFPPWAEPANGCPRLDKVGGSIVKGYETFPGSEEGKFNPCYYTKAFAGLDSKLGGYPTPIDTRYPYEFAAPFFRQPGDGSTHHCPIDSPPETKIQSCPKVNEGCGEGVKDCVTITDKYGIGHIPPFVTLNAVKKGYIACEETVCTEWFDFDTNGCNIKPSMLNTLNYRYFGKNNTIQFGPPILGDDGLPTPFYYKLEYLNEGTACDEGNCRGPHYCSKEAADEDIWGDFCPYVHTGPNSGQYRHPHLALAALELWIANKCMPEQCPSEWLKSPNGIGYGTKNTSTTITWAEMEKDTDPMSQPAVPYKWPATRSRKPKSIWPGHGLYYGMAIKPVQGFYVTEHVAATDFPPSAGPKTGGVVGFLSSITFASFLVWSLM